MWFNLKLTGPEGPVPGLRYNSHTSELQGMDFQNLPEAPNWSEAPRVSPATPVGKSPAPRVLKIQMGLACNYSCSYCLQALEVVNDDVSLLEDARQFIAQIDSWLEGTPEEIQFWGGEPFVYWAKLKALVPQLKERFPAASVVIITNGSVLDREKITFIDQFDISIGISHDGPGHKRVRGPDPFEDPDKLHWIQELVRRRPGQVSFNAVLTKGNTDFRAIESHIQGYFDEPVVVGLEGVVNTYDAATLLGSGSLQQDDLSEMSNGLFDYLLTEDNPGLEDMVERFMKTILERRPLSAVGQKCGMDRPDMLAVDLKGNVQTCQNTGSKGKHKIGHVSNFDEIALDTSTHFSHRENCLECPLVQLCRGSCMYLEGDFFNQSCRNEFAFNMAFFRAAIFRFTGMVLTEIEGPFPEVEVDAPLGFD